MAAQWKVDSVEARVSQDGLSNVVSVVHWRANANDASHAVTRYGSVAVGGPDPADFIPYQNLDEATVVGWAKAALGDEKVAEIETALENELLALATPTVVTPPLPWN